MTWQVYMLRCANNDIYVGRTTDLERRLFEHKTAQGGKFTRTFKFAELIHSESFELEHDAVAREKQLKRWSRSKKLALTSGKLEALKQA